MALLPPGPIRRFLLGPALLKPFLLRLAFFGEIQHMLDTGREFRLLPLQVVNVGEADERKRGRLPEGFQAFR